MNFPFKDQTWTFPSKTTHVNYWDEKACQETHEVSVQWLRYSTDCKAIQHLRYLRSLSVGPAYWLVHRDSHFINDDHLQYSKDSMTPHIHQPTGVLNIAHLGRICSWKLCWRFKWGRWTRPRINHWRFNRWTLWLDSQFIGLVYGKKLQETPYLMVQQWFPVDFPLNQSIDQWMDVIELKLSGLQHPNQWR